MIYFDNSATTQPCEKAKENTINALEKFWGNPSSLHEMGYNAEEELEKARKTVAHSLNCKADEIIFTSGGTQANNIAVFGSVNAKKRAGKRIITTKAEHPSVAKCFERLASDGFDVVTLDIDKTGQISLAQLEENLTDDTIFVSVMCVNNELGTVYPVSEIVSLVRKKAKNAIIHTDCVQAYGKITLDVKKLGIDLLTVSSHKIHGPKGAGALYVKKGTKLLSPVCGGEQESEIRPGTEPVPSIFGMAAAVSEFDIDNSYKKISQIRDYLYEKLSQNHDIVINSTKDSLPYIMSVALPGYPSEVMLNYFSDNEIYLSSGSACAKGHKSPVLINAGLDSSVINSTLRISFSKYTTQEEADEFLQVLEAGMKRIRKSKNQ